MRDHVKIRIAAALLSLCALWGCGGGKTAPEAAPAGTESGAAPELSAAAREEQSAPAPVESTMAPAPEEKGPWEWDVDGDGTAETVEIVLLDKEWECYGVRVTSSERSDTRDSSAIYNPRLRIEDLDGDGASEILFWGDTGSDDYLLTVLRWDDGFTAVPFVDKSEGEPEDRTDGEVETVEGNSITVKAWQYVLGTYRARLRYELGDDGLFRPAAGAVWEFIDNETYLTTARELSGAMDDGTSVIPQGTQLRLLGWDGISQVYFETGDGVRGVLSVSPGEEYGWTIGGVQEDDCFTFLPYAG